MATSWDSDPRSEFDEPYLLATGTYHQWAATHRYGGADAITHAHVIAHHRAADAYFERYPTADPNINYYFLGHPAVDASVDTLTYPGAHGHPQS